jgi:RNA polymerase sigma factor (sigma-70 family)
VPGESGASTITEAQAEDPVRNWPLPAIHALEGLVNTSSDRDRLEAIFREHYEAVLAYSRRRAPAALADDVAAETFAIAWRRAADVPKEPLPWLLGVARRVLSSQRRSGVRRDRLRRRLFDASGAAQPVELADGRVSEALARLSEPDREAVLLIAWEGLAPREAAAALGVSAATFSVRLHRARRRLRTALTQDHSLATHAREGEAK